MIEVVLVLLSIVINLDANFKLKEGVKRDIVKSITTEELNSTIIAKFNSDTLIAEVDRVEIVFIGYKLLDEEHKILSRDIKDQCSIYSGNRELLKECEEVSNKALTNLNMGSINRYSIPLKYYYDKSLGRLTIDPKHRLDRGFYELVIKSLNLKYIFEIKEDNLKDIRLDIEDKHVLNVYSKSGSQVALQARYIDNNSSYYHDRSTEANYYIADSDIVAIGKRGIFIPKKQGKTIAISSYHNKVSLPVLLEAEEVINGYKLPPQPDLKESDTTLEGIDTNSNGIRDDVERKIIKRYKHNKLATALLLSGAKQYQAVLEQPLSNAQEIRKEISRYINCRVYLARFNSEIDSDNFLVTRILKDMVYTTRDRTERFLEYNYALSGDSYGSGVKEVSLKACDKEVQEVLEEINR
jgi:hypothetical protein